MNRTKQQLAQLMNISTRTFYRRIKKHPSLLSQCKAHGRNKITFYGEFIFCSIEEKKRSIMDYA